MKISNILLSMFYIITIMSMVVLAWLKLDTFFTFKERELRIRAVEGCMTSSSYKHEDEESKIVTVEPKKDIYDKCMKDKGY